MAVTDFGLTNTTALSSVPGPAGNIDSTSTPVNTDELTEFREEASGTIASILRSRGIGSLNDDSVKVIHRAIKAYVAWKVLQQHEGNGGAASSFRSEWEDTKKIIAMMPDQLGDSHNSDATYQSNIDSTNPAPRKWTRLDSNLNGFKDW